MPHFCFKAWRSRALMRGQSPLPGSLWTNDSRKCPPFLPEPLQFMPSPPSRSHSWPLAYPSYGNHSGPLQLPMDLHVCLKVTCYIKSNFNYNFLVPKKKKKKDNSYIKFKSTAINKLIQVITLFDYSQLTLWCIIIQNIFLCLYVYIHT